MEDKTGKHAALPEKKPAADDRAASAPFRLWALPLFFYGAILYSELILRGAVGTSAELGDWLLLLFFSLPPALILWGLCSLLPSRWAGRIASAAVVALAVFFCSQLIYYRIFYTYYIAYSALNGGQVYQFWREILDTALANALPLLLLLAPILVLRLLERGRELYRRLPGRNAAVIFMLAVILHVSNLGLVLQTGREALSPYDLYFHTSYMDAAADRFGLLTAMRLDAKHTLFGDTLSVRASQPMENTVSSPVPASTVSAPPDGLTQNVTNLDFAAMAAGESDAALREMDRYFAGVKPTAKNEKTGIYKGYNLILITAEGFSPYAVDETLTPTLYKMATEGYRFTNFYTPIWGVSTSDGEYVNCTGLIPKAGVWSMAQSAENAMPLTLGNQLKALGYSTWAYHDHTYSYYHRDKSHPNLGYTTYKAVGKGLEIKQTWPESDLEMIDVTTPDYIGRQPFHVYYMTVSGHLRYSFSGNAMSYKNRALVADLPYSDTCRAYLACNIELDRAMELLLRRLEEAGIAERTVIALTPDHYPYGLTTEQISELAGHRVEENFELYKSTLLLYVPGMTPETVEEPCSNLDILPTLSNMLGLEYDSRLLMGRDVFSDAAPLVIFKNRSWITDKGMYNAKTKTFTQTAEGELPEKYVQAVSQKVEQKFRYSALILEKNYYALVMS